MRKRSQTTMAKLEAKEEDIRRWFQTLKMEHSILQQKFEKLEEQRDILKQGNQTLISQFLFDKHRDELNRLSNSLQQKNQQITELKKILQEIDKNLRGLNYSYKARDNSKEKESHMFEHSSNFTIRTPNDKIFQSLRGKKAQLDPNQLKQNVTKLKQSYEKELTLNKQLQEENSKLGQEIEFLRTQLQQISNELQISSSEQLLKNNQELIKKVQEINQQLLSLTNQNYRLNQIIKQSEGQSKTKEKQLTTQNKELFEKIKQLDRQVKLRKSTLENNDSKLQNLPFKQTRFNDTEINMTVSICNTQDMKNSLIYQKLSQSSMQQSIVTESYDKKFSRLEKTNASLQKDYKNSQQKIKSISREYSKLKLDYLKLSEQWKLREDEFEKRIQILNNKLQSASKRSKQHETIVSSIKAEKQRQKQTLKSIILQLESKNTEQQNYIEKYKLQIQNLKEQIESTKKIHQITSQNNSQLQNEKNKNKMLEKTVKQYESIIQYIRKINYKQKQDSKQNYFSQKDQKSMIGLSKPLISPEKKTNASSSNLKINIENDTILKALKSQIQVLETNLKLQNERYNVLDNSNKQLRKQLLKMIDQEQKLRKDLINQKIKTKTKSISSKNSKSFVSRRLKQDFSQQKNERKLNQCESNLHLPIGSNSKNLNEYKQRNTERSFDQMDLRKGLYSSNSNSQIGINTDQNNINEGKKLNVKFQGSYLKAMRERRFDPQETSNAVSVKQSYLTEKSRLINQKSQNLNQKKNTETQRISFQLPQNNSLNNIDSNGFHKFQSPAAKKSQNESYKNPTPTTKKTINENNSAQTKSIVNPQRQYEKEDKIPISGTIKQINNNSESKRYVYQPPKKYIPGLKLVTSITEQNERPVIQMTKELTVHDEKEEELISLSNDNREITLQISSSKSNRSRADMILESIRVQNNNDEKNRSSRSIKEPQSDKKIQSPEPIDESATQIKKNIILAGKIQSTKSNAQVRFMRKN